MGVILRYISFMTPGLAAGMVVFFLLLRFRKKKLAAQKLRSGKIRELGLLLFCMYCGGMAAITLAPEPGWIYFAVRGSVSTPYFDLGHLPQRVSLVPFSQLDRLVNIIGNVVMFLPFGFFAALLWRGWNWKKALGLGFAITAGIECWQILVGRYFDIDDIILNTLGVFCGYFLWVLPDRFALKLTEKFHVNEEAA